MIIKIVLSIFVALVVAVSITYIVNDLYRTHLQLTSFEKLFYSQNFDTKEKKIFIIGSSHAGRINATLVENNISKNYENYRVYNLGYVEDNPSLRINHLQKIIESKPVLVIYGITFKDIKKTEKVQTQITDVIVSSKPKDVLPEPWVFLYDWIPNKTKIDFSNFDNPQGTTLKIFEMLSSQNNTLESSSDLGNTPFYKYLPKMNNIMDEKSLRKNLQNRIEAGSVFTGYEKDVNNLQTDDLKHIISKLKDNNIDVILFSTPFSRIYLETIDEDDIQIFEGKIQKISDKFNVKVYHFYDKYADMNIWSDTSHISINQTSSIYSQDISDIILNEIEK